MMAAFRHDTGKGFSIVCGGAYVGEDSEIRHVVMIHKNGVGHSVSWDSTPYTHDYWRQLSSRPDRRPQGIMAMKKFQKWAQHVLLTPLESA